MIISVLLCCEIGWYFSMNQMVKMKEFIKATHAETLSVRQLDELVPESYIEFPLGELFSLGAVFSSLPSAFASLTKSTTHGNVLYEATFPVPGRLAESKDGGLLGTIINRKGIAGQARFHEVQGAARNASTISMMFMALAIMAVNKSLKEVAQNQKAILTFLEVDKQTKLKGDLIVLSDILADYHLNWDNRQYCSSREMQVLDIKRSAEHNILFYREMIEKKLGRQTYVHIDTAKTLNDVISMFRYYKLALYLYAFSSFLDIMLLENFESNYLESVLERITCYSSEYDSFYQKSVVGVEKYAASSLQARTLQGLSIASRFIGEHIAKIPDADNKIRIDDRLISGSAKLDSLNSDSLTKTIESFSSVKDSGIMLFADRIQLFDRMHNEELRVLFDNEHIYIPNPHSS